MGGKLILKLFAWRPAVQGE